MTIACADTSVAARLQDELSSPSLRLYTNDDVIGVELGGALKNVIAIATGIVDGLEERGYVERRPHETDRRVKVVTITALGEKAKAKAMERLHEPPASLLNALTQNEQRTLRDLLRKVRNSTP